MSERKPPAEATSGTVHCFVSRVAVALLGLIGWAALLCLMTWLMGRVVTDRYGWSQWLWWIPTPAAILFALVGLLAALRPSRLPQRRRWRVFRWSGVLLAMLAYFALGEHRLFHQASVAATNSHVVSIAHWNPTAPPGSVPLESVIDRFIALDGDITLLTGANQAVHDERVRQVLGGGQNPVVLGTVAVLSRFPIVSARVLVATRGAFISAVTIETTPRLGRPIVIYAVDLPSDPRIERMALTRHLRLLLDELASSANPPPPADVVVGDFNITRGSASLKVLFPSLRHAFDEAGHGYGATFHRNAPFSLYHIDHVLLAPSLSAVRYDLIDTGVARHCAQKTWIAPQRAGR